MIGTPKIFSALVSILFNYILYAYLERLEQINCDCSNTITSNGIKSMILVNYVLIFGVLFVGNIPESTGVFATILSIVFAITTFKYLHSLKNKQCECSDSMIRDIYYYYYFLIFVTYGILLSIFVLLVLAVLLSDTSRLLLK